MKMATKEDKEKQRYEKIWGAIFTYGLQKETALFWTVS